MLTDVYRYIGTHLRNDIERTTKGDRQRRMLQLAAQLFDDLHALAQKMASTWDAESRAMLDAAHHKYRSRLPVIEAARVTTLAGSRQTNMP